MVKLRRAGLLLMLFPGAFVFLCLLFLPIYHELHGVFVYHYSFNPMALYRDALLPALKSGGPLLLITGITWRWRRIGSVIAIALSLLILTYLIYRFLNPYDFLLIQGYIELFLTIMFLTGSILVVISERRTSRKLKR